MLTVPDGTGEAFSGNLQWVGACLDYPPSDWKLIRDKARSQDIKVIPWVRLARVGEGEDEVDVEQRLKMLVDCAVAWNTDWILPNYEDEAKTITPHTVVQLLKGTGWQGNTGWSMQGWQPNDVDYSPMNDDPVLLQIFPEDLKWLPPEIPKKTGDCVYHARVDHGFTYVGVTYQSYRNAIPEWYDVDIPHSAFTGNTIPATEWHDWFPR